MNKKDEEWVTAEASLIPLDSVRVTKDAYKSLRPGNQQARKAAQVLQKLGFAIEAEGVVSISISGKKETFEKTFDIQLEKRCTEAKEKEAKLTETCYYSPVGKPKIPQGLDDLVYEIVFPVPPTTFT